MKKDIELAPKAMEILQTSVEKNDFYLSKSTHGVYSIGRQVLQCENNRKQIILEESVRELYDNGYIRMKSSNSYYVTKKGIDVIDPNLCSQDKIISLSNQIISKALAAVDNYVHIADLLGERKLFTRDKYGISDYFYSADKGRIDDILIDASLDYLMDEGLVSEVGALSYRLTSKAIKFP